MEPAAAAPPVDPGAIRKAIEKRLCDRCLGRLFAVERKGRDFVAQGEEIRKRLEAAYTPASKCYMCEGLCDEFDELAGAVVKALDGYEFQTMLVGTTIDAALIAREGELVGDLGVPAPHPLKQEVNREVGLRVSALLGKDADFTDPDIVALVDARFNGVRLQVKSAYFRGRYRKLARGIPQTRWPCRSCRGRGCKRCGGTGKMYDRSVEEIVAAPLMAALGGKDHALHGAGREDVDALMLGRGRPFVVEIRSPKRRTADLEAVMRSIAVASNGEVEVSGLAPCLKGAVVALKDADWLKTYRVLVALEKDIKDDQINRACVELTGTLIHQQTPTRVAHRRADKVRQRRVERVALLSKDGPRIELSVTGESGLYVKELVHGDQGRTKPSLSGLLGVACEVKELDVSEIHDTKGPGE